MYYVYVLICADGKSYVGCTSDLKERIVRHTKKQVQATKERLPISLKAYFAFENELAAYKFEHYLKSGSGRTFLSKHVFNE